MTDETENLFPAPPVVPSPNPVRPDMSLNGRAGFSYEIEEGEVNPGDLRSGAIVTLPNDTKFMVELTGVSEADREKTIEDAVVNHEVVHDDPVVQARVALPPTTPQEI